MNDLARCHPYRGQGEDTEIVAWATSTCTMTDGKQVRTYAYTLEYRIEYHYQHDTHTSVACREIIHLFQLKPNHRY